MTTFEEKQKQLFEALMANRANQNVMNAITAHVEGKTGLKLLSEFMKNGASEADKIAMINEVLMIANGGQPKAAAATVTETATTPAPAPPVKRIDPFAMADEAPPKERPVAQQDARMLLNNALQLAALQINRMVDEAAPTASEEQIRRICREEIRRAMGQLAKAMQQ